MVLLYQGSILSHFTAASEDNELLGIEVTTENCKDDCVAYLAKLDKYCYRSILNGGNQPALEGQLTDHTAKNFQLKHIHVVVRHGDRTPVNANNIGSTMFYQCGLVDDDINWDGLRDFPPPMPLPSRARVMNTHMKLHPGNHSRSCGVGKLTQSGFKQHRYLGALLRLKYNTFLNNISSHSRNIFVHSTDTSRTVHSGASFLLGFLPDSRKIRQSIPIHVSRGTVNNAPPIGIQRTYPPCKELYDFHTGELTRNGYLKAEKKLYNPLFEKLSNLFHISIQTTPTKIFDHFSTRGCHAPKFPLPCSENGCVDFEFGLSLSLLCDWIWSNKYPLNSSILTVLPFLKHSVLDPMELSVGREKGEEMGPSYDVMLTFSHDDTITMILNSLGVHVEQWMPYSSRVVFELWQEKGEEYYVRILFNGDVITHKMFPWKLYAREDADANRELLPLELWSEFFTSGRFRDPESYNRACKNT